jgi:hypothetical protein
VVLINSAVKESTGNNLDTLLRAEFNRKQLENTGSNNGTQGRGGILAEPEAKSNLPRVTTNTGIINLSSYP